MDTLQNFVFDNHPVRGEWVRFDKIYQNVLSQHHYPPVLQRLLAEAMAAVVMLYGISKQQGRLTLQFQGDGAIKLLSVRCTHDYHCRGLIDWEGALDDHDSLAQALGHGTLALTYEPGQGQSPYQSIVEVKGSSIAEALENYFLQSEQLPTRFWIASDNQQVVGFMLQLMPSQSHTQASSWEHVVHLADTLQPNEMLSEVNLTLLHRLFHQEEVRVFEPQSLDFGCGHTKERTDNAILSLGKAEAEKMLAEHGSIEVKCEFCGAETIYDTVDVETLFKIGRSSGGATHVKH